MVSLVITTIPIQATYNQAQQIVENRNRFGDDPRKRPQNQRNQHPRSNRHESALVHAVGPPEQTDVDVLASHMTIDHASDNNLTYQPTFPPGGISYRRKSDAVGYLGQQRTGRAQRG